MNAAVAHAAAAWWADKLKGCKQQIDGPDNRDQTVAIATAMMLACRPSVSDDQVARFTASLQAAIEQEPSPGSSLLRGGDGPHHHLVLEVDYYPGTLLGEALKASVVPLQLGVLPCKTWMRLFSDRIEVSYGYRAAPEVIYSAEREAGLR